LAISGHDVRMVTADILKGGILVEIAHRIAAEQ
jgi:hypothetical protein